MKKDLNVAWDMLKESSFARGAAAANPHILSSIVRHVSKPARDVSGCPYIKEYDIKGFIIDIGIQVG